MISDKRLEQLADVKMICICKDAEYQEMAKELLAYRKASSWIAVSERMPEENTEVWVWGESDDLENYPMIAEWDPDMWYGIDRNLDSCTKIFNVTHWMPLPPNPTN